MPRVGVALFFATYVGASNLSSDPHRERVRIFDRIGIGQWFRHLTSATQIAGGILLLIPRTMTPHSFPPSWWRGPLVRRRTGMVVV